MSNEQLSTKDILQTPPVEMAAGCAGIFGAVVGIANGAETAEFNVESIVSTGLPYAAAIGGAALFAHGLYRAVRDFRGN